METGRILFDPLVPWPALWVVAGLAVVLAGFALWRGLSGWWIRALALACVLGALSGPSVETEERSPLSDIVLLVRDETSSQGLSDRAAQTAAAVDRVREEIAALPGTELREITLRDAPEDGGSLMVTALGEALAEEPRARIAGAVLLTDGQAHDADLALSDFPAPVHVLLTGHSDDWDRRIVLHNSPAFGIIGEPLEIILSVEDDGAVPAGLAGRAALSIAIDGGPAETYQVPVGEKLELPVTLSHGGQNVIQLTLDPAEGELTDRNNEAVVQINGVRDRLRVLLVSGAPHAGERTWRNLLKSDAAVDLVHFTILRPPEKQDGVPVSELSLIAFPTRELFVEKIEEFDLIIFDRYRLRGILPQTYLGNVRDYVEGGGALLVAAGPDFATAESIFHSPLADVLPAEPTARVIEQGYRPEISETGHRHPVTRGIEEEAASAALPEADGAERDGPPWGRWFRLVDLENPRGAVVMEGPDKRPLLVLDRVGEGRVALLASDQAWLWSRGYEGGGPQLELLRRLAHWLMKEPELEEEALVASVKGQEITVTRRSLSEEPRSVEITAPDGTVATLALPEVEPGRFGAVYQGEAPGLYRLSDGERETVVALGPPSPKEFERTIADPAPLSALVAQREGASLGIEDGLPDIRQVREGRPAAGRGWIGITPRGAYVTADVSVSPFLPDWLLLLIATALAVVAWLREGRR